MFMAFMNRVPYVDNYIIFCDTLI